MGVKSEIQWTDATWNAWHGCKKVSEGCKYCYMFRDKERYGQEPTEVLKSKSNFNAPLKWTEPKLIFTCSWSDWFIQEADEWREEAREIIKATPHHTYQILTKRPERILECLPDDWGDGYENVWIGVSVENQEMADIRIPLLLEIPAKVRFLSCEPLIDKVDLSDYILHSDELGGAFIDKNLIHWVIVGGESGNETGKYTYRECNLAWIEEIVNYCQDSDVPVFVKQMGTATAKMLKLKSRHGSDISEWTKHLRVREFPKTYKKEL